MNGIKTGLGITPGEHIISAASALSRNIRHCFCLSCRGRLILQTGCSVAPGMLYNRRQPFTLQFLTQRSAPVRLWEARY